MWKTINGNKVNIGANNHKQHSDDRFEVKKGFGLTSDGRIGAKRNRPKEVIRIEKVLDEVKAENEYFKRQLKKGTRKHFIHAYNHTYQGGKFDRILNKFPTISIENVTFDKYRYFARVNDLQRISAEMSNVVANGWATDEEWKKYFEHDIEEIDRNIKEIEKEISGY